MAYSLLTDILMDSEVSLFPKKPQNVQHKQVKLHITNLFHEHTYVSLE